MLCAVKMYAFSPESITIVRIKIYAKLHATHKGDKRWESFLNSIKYLCFVLNDILGEITYVYPSIAQIVCADVSSQCEIQAGINFPFSAW